MICFSPLTLFLIFFPFPAGKTACICLSPLIISFSYLIERYSNCCIIIPTTLIQYFNQLFCRKFIFATNFIGFCLRNVLKMHVFLRICAFFVRICEHFYHFLCKLFKISTIAFACCLLLIYLNYLFSNN